MAEAVLELENIHKSFGSLNVLKGVNLRADAGQVISMIGSSGSGKSTLLRCANLLETPQEGEVVFQGEAIAWRGNGDRRQPQDSAQVRRIRANLAMVFQQFNLWAHLTVLQNVIEAPVSVLGLEKDEAEDRALTLLKRVGIGDKANAFPSQLSGGQQQRAAIARALCMQPAAMLFDEPTSALDPELEVEVVRVIKSLAEEGRTMVIVTHDMKLAEDVADECVFLHQGLIEERGAPKQLFKRPKSARLKQFLNAGA